MKNNTIFMLICGLMVFFLLDLYLIFYIIDVNKNLRIYKQDVYDLEEKTFILTNSMLRVSKLHYINFSDKNELNGLKNKVVLLFPKNICDICNQKLFKEIKFLDESTKQLLVAVVPQQSYRNFIALNESFGLEIKNVLVSDQLNEISLMANNDIVLFYCTPELRLLYPIILNKWTSELDEYFTFINLSI